MFQTKGTEREREIEREIERESK